LGLRGSSFGADLLTTIFKEAFVNLQFYGKGERSFSLGKMMMQI